jgi:endogenous inhibitor of DNA gyrase (YacG/DUF329 family)
MISEKKKKVYLTDKKVVECIWHFLIEDTINKTITPDKQHWEFVTGIFNQDMGYNLNPDDVKKRFIRYFYERFGIAPFLQCPICGKGITWPRVSKYDYFIGCCFYPKCNFMATNKNPFDLGFWASEKKDKSQNRSQSDQAEGDK